MGMKAQEEKTNDKYWKVEATKRETRREEITVIALATVTMLKQ